MRNHFLQILIAAYIFVACNNQQVNSPLTHQSEPSKAMDTFQFSFQNANPKAQTLMTDEFFFSPIEETGPFGSDDGWEAAYGFRKWRNNNKTNSPIIFLKELISSWQYPYFDYTEMDTLKIKEYIEQKKVLSEAEIETNIRLLKTLTANSPDKSGKPLTDEQLREVVLSSQKGMNSLYLLGQDNAIIGIGFAQLALEGQIDKEMKSVTITAIKRQLLPMLLNQYEEDVREKRKDQLAKMLAVVSKSES